MTPIETTAFVLGVVNVTMVVRRSVWNFPFGLAMVALYAWIFREARLYSDAGLQVFFFVVQLYGWANWARYADRKGEVPVARLSASARAAWLAGSIAAVAVWGAGMHRWTNAAYPWWDGAVAMLSVAAQVMMARRLLENWAWWIAVDLLAIGLYAARDLWLTALLYVIFLALSVWGLIDWRREARRVGL